ncbi:MAG: transcriptional regulator [Bacteroidales bacterium]|jgi:DNA-binding HxlR family transcriptional regulator|nr:transcriptional regulator [Bacteroidales bacterium]
MKNIISGLNKLFDSRIRLGIMATLSVNDNLAFNTLKELLDITDGNLASHLKALEKNGLIEVSKRFIERKPNTTYSITAAGKCLFEQHLNALERLINPE